MIDWNAIGAIATAMAVIIALLQPLVSRWWSKPRVTLELRRRDTELKFKSVTGPATTQVDDFHGNVRLLVANNGRCAAEQLRVTVTDVYRAIGRDGYEVVEGFVQSALNWTHSGSPVLAVLPAHTKTLVDFGYLNPKDSSFPPQLEHVTLYTEVQPSSKYNVLDRGSYIGRLAVSGANFAASVQLIALSFGGDIGSQDFFRISYATDDNERRVKLVDRAAAD